MDGGREQVAKCNGDRVSLAVSIRENKKFGVFNRRYNFGYLLSRRKLKERLRIAPKVTIGYQIHKDTMAKAGSVTKNTYIV